MGLADGLDRKAPGLLGLKGTFIRLPRLSCSFAQRQYVVAAIT